MLFKKSPIRHVKDFMRSDRTHTLISWILHKYLAFVFYTTRWEKVGFEVCDARLADMSKKGFFISLWHSRVAMMPFIWGNRERDLTILNSAHRDGQIVSKIMQLSGVGSINVTSKGNNLSAARNVMRAIQEGKCVGVTPDGPRGPAREMKLLPLEWARVCQCELAVIGYSVKYRFTLGTWDKLIIPLPFNRGVFIWKEVFHSLPKDASAADMETYRAQYEAALDALTDEADRRMGHASK